MLGNCDKKMKGICLQYKSSLQGIRIGCERTKAKVGMMSEVKGLGYGQCERANSTSCINGRLESLHANKMIETPHSVVF